MKADHEPPFPGVETVVFALSAPDWTAHWPTRRCQIAEPHLAAECREWTDPPDAVDALQAALRARGRVWGQDNALVLRETRGAAVLDPVSAGGYRILRSDDDIPQRLPLRSPFTW